VGRFVGILAAAVLTSHLCQDNKIIGAVPDQSWIRIVALAPGRRTALRVMVLSPSAMTEATSMLLTSLLRKPATMSFVPLTSI